MTQLETKEIIICKVFKLLLKKGYDGVSITDIQNEIGMARGLLYHYFGSKEQLFIEVTTRYFLEMFNVDLERVKYFSIPQLIDYTLERYQDILTKSFDYFAKDDAISIVDYDFLFYRVMQENEIFYKRYKQFREHELFAWRLAVNNSISLGELRDIISTDKCALYFTYLMDGVWMGIVNKNKPEILLEDLREALTDYYKLLIK